MESVMATNIVSFSEILFIWVHIFTRTQTNTLVYFDQHAAWSPSPLFSMLFYPLAQDGYVYAESTHASWNVYDRVLDRVLAVRVPATVHKPHFVVALLHSFFKLTFAFSISQKWQSNIPCLIVPATWISFRLLVFESLIASSIQDVGNWNLDNVLSDLCSASCSLSTAAGSWSEIKSFHNFAWLWWQKEHLKCYFQV